VECKTGSVVHEQELSPQWWSLWKNTQTP